jgi:formylglycine-generating enzyme required for sulfatase activity
MPVHQHRSPALASVLAAALLAAGPVCAKNPEDSPPKTPPAATSTASAAASVTSAPGKAATPSSDEGRCTPETVFLPGGSFKLGATGKLVKVDAFCIDMNEVTARQYAFCVDVNRCSSEGLYDGSWATYLHYPDHPLNYVTWEQADHYCKVHLQRLPTEAEWEWAARGGPAGNIYPWGNDPPTAEPCWSGPGNDAPDGKRDQTCALGSHADMTPQGVFDMAGNVYEWTATPAGQGVMIIKGGCFREDQPSGMRSSMRQPKRVSDGSHLTGFRCVQSPKPAKP